MYQIVLTTQYSRKLTSIVGVKMELNVAYEGIVAERIFTLQKGEKLTEAAILAFLRTFIHEYMHEFPDISCEWYTYDNYSFYPHLPKVAYKRR